MKTVNEFYMFLTGLNGWAFVYKLSGFAIDSCCSYLNFRYCTCFEYGAPCHSGNYRVYIHSKTRMWHDKNIQLHSYRSTLFYKSISFAVELRHLRISMMEQLQSRLARTGSGFLVIWLEERFLFLWLFLLGSKKKNHEKNHSYLTNSQ